jgi:hypothetical protein
VPNPLAIGVTLGGLLLDVLAPRPKPRAGFPPEYLSSPGGPARGQRGAVGMLEHGRAPIGQR